MSDEQPEQTTEENNQQDVKEQSQPTSVQIGGEDENGEKLPVEFLNDVPIKLTVELGVGEISIRELMQLGHGAVFELDKLAGEPLEVKINDRLISRGEVVVVNDRYAIRLTDVINPEEINN